MSDGMRQCTKCGVVRHRSMFYEDLERRRAKREGHSRVTIHCRECQREANAKAYAPRLAITDQAKLVGCMDCGIKNPEHPEIYDFDHRPGEVKSGSVSTFLRKGTVEDLCAEMAKCDIVCSNCHRIRTRSRGTTLKPYRALGMEPVECPAPLTLQDELFDGMPL